MAWLRTSTGRSRQLEQMGTELDPSVETYGHDVRSFGDDLDQLLGIGSWRLPRSRFAAAMTLWSLWEVEETIQGNRSLEAMVDAVKERLTALLLLRQCQARKMWRELLRRNHHYQDDPTWFESDGRMIRDADTWFYLRHKHLVMMAVLAITFGECCLLSRPSPHRQFEMCTAFMRRRKRNATIIELDLAIRQAEVWKFAGDQHYKRGDFVQAGWGYLQAVARLAPWCPLELYMPRWEARLTGLSSLYFALFFNLGLVGLKLEFAQWTICSADAIIDHPFITNRLSAKLHHLKARAMEMLATRFPKDPSDEPTARPDYAYESKRHDSTRDVYVRLNPNKVSFASECCDFDVRSAMDTAHKLGDYGDSQHSVEREFEEDGVLGRAEMIMRERTEPVWLLGEDL